jgi:hypothetical protein
MSLVTAAVILFAVAQAPELARIITADRKDKRRAKGGQR